MDSLKHKIIETVIVKIVIIEPQLLSPTTHGYPFAEIVWAILNIINKYPIVITPTKREMSSSKERYIEVINSHLYFKLSSPDHPMWQNRFGFGNFLV